MKLRCNLFLLRGNSIDVAFVLQKLFFDRLVSVPFGTSINESFIKSVFDKNKSLVCSESDFPSNYDKSNAIFINVELHYNYRNTFPAIYICNLDIAQQFENIVSEYGCDIGNYVTNSVRKLDNISI